MKEKLSIINLSEKQQANVKGGTEPLLCSACAYYVWTGSMWIQTCGWTLGPGAGCPFTGAA